MPLIPDGNSAALRRFEREQSDASKLWDDNAERVADEMVDELFSDGKVAGFTLQDLAFDYLTPDDLAMIFRSQPREKMLEAFEDADKKLRANIKGFFLEHCSDDVWERIDTGAEE